MKEATFESVAVHKNKPCHVQLTHLSGLAHAFRDSLTPLTRLSHLSVPHRLAHQHPPGLRWVQRAVHC
jgi:hypothetical protein